MAVATGRLALLYGFGSAAGGGRGATSGSLVLITAVDKFVFCGGFLLINLFYLRALISLLALPFGGGSTNSLNISLILVRPAYLVTIVSLGFSSYFLSLLFVSESTELPM